MKHRRMETLKEVRLARIKEGADMLATFSRAESLILKEIREMVDGSARDVNYQLQQITDNFLREVRDQNWLVERLGDQLLTAKATLDELILGAEERLREALREARAQTEPQLPPIPFDIICEPRHARPGIYGLVSQDEPSRIRYVGKSSNPAGRYAPHCSSGAALQVADWVRSLNGLPLMVSIESCDPLELEDREAHWIHYYRGIGQADLNASIPRLKRA
jgi:hypothetical protein